ncbi:uncharacterized protein [Spinacia oleracea]|uniref:Uncharacterized protein LOC110787879 n=1 Tax=Spinacia oleracea TaxID=3562 RepID=A0A9R0IFJ8_SPIOL|nr:uncharacterized protein LOC110787879 [Spinacia oleracea]XP_056698831.1 uncharacterized protein LOC110787879 [Spinacia oleracea]
MTDAVRQTQPLDEYSSEEDQPLRIQRRRVASTSDKRAKALFLKLRRNGAFSYKHKKPHRQPGSHLKKQCDATLSNESSGEGKGSWTSGWEKEPSLHMTEDDFPREVWIGEDEPELVIPRSNDEELIFEDIGFQHIPPEDDITPKLCRITVDSEFGEKSEFVKLLKEINCENRFAACSVQYPLAFYARLNKSEVDNFRDVKGINQVFVYEGRTIFTHR